MFASIAIIAYMLMSITTTTDAFGTKTTGHNTAKQSTELKNAVATMSRSTFVTGAVGTLLMPSMAFAKGLEDANFQGTQSKANEKICLDRCIYDCTKNGTPKEKCLAACKEECKTSKGQLTYGTPNVDKGSETTQ